MSVYKGEYFPGGMVHGKNRDAQLMMEFPSKERIEGHVDVVSLIIPYRVNDIEGANRLVRLVKCVAGRKDEGESGFGSIVVVDDHSTYSCDELLAEYNVDILENLNAPGPAGARNQGIKFLLACRRQDVIAFTDSDCVPSDDWSDSIKMAFNNDNSAMVFSGRTLSLGNTRFDIEEDAVGLLNGRILLGSSQLLYGTTCNLAVSVEMLNEGVRFNEQFDTAAGEDVEFCFKALKSGFRTKFCELMQVRHDFGYTGEEVHDTAIRASRMSRYVEGYKRMKKIYPEFETYYKASAAISNC